MSEVKKSGGTEKYDSSEIRVLEAWSRCVCDRVCILVRPDMMDYIT